MERRDEDPEATERARELRRRATPWEAILWRGLRAGPNRWRRSHPLSGFFLDLYCDAARLTVECDGAKHDPMYDAWRDGKVKAAGILTLRFTNVEVGADPEGCLARIRATDEGGEGGSVPKGVAHPLPPLPQRGGRDRDAALLLKARGVRSPAEVCILGPAQGLGTRDPG